MGGLILTDMHHNTLMRSHVLLFENRLGYEVHRPIGMEWFTEGFWAINDLEATARQFLEPGDQPLDGTPPLNEWQRSDGGRCRVFDPGRDSMHTAVTLDYFREHEYEFIVASTPQHYELFRKLRDLYQPNATLIMQVGNQEWPLEWFVGGNVLASTLPRAGVPANVCWYRQEFDTQIFHEAAWPSVTEPVRHVASYVNVLQEHPQSWSDYHGLRVQGEPYGIDVRAYGGQCPDGNMIGPHELAASMRRQAAVLHSKQGGDGYGHIIHNAASIGRPLIVRGQWMAGRLSQKLLVPGCYWDLDEMGPHEVIKALFRCTGQQLSDMGAEVAANFRAVCDFEEDARTVGEWLKTIR